jgi:methylenetetrahydrofolate--tRNA-(uracil-5-)-methyltransferase
LTARQMAARLMNLELPPLPRTTLMSALLENHLFDHTSSRFTPMNVNFGLLPPIDGVKRGRRAKQERKLAYGRRSLEDLQTYLDLDEVHSFLAGI